MTGHGPIVLRLVNHAYHEHVSLADARREAERLVDKLGTPCVVYLPVVVVTPPQGRRTSLVPITDDARALLEDSDLPF